MQFEQENFPPQLIKVFIIYTLMETVFVHDEVRVPLASLVTRIENVRPTQSAAS
jgi:hypothetical protein